MKNSATKAANVKNATICGVKSQGLAERTV